ncbi:Innexin unc 7 [Echinococcus multilocularis]|uniref:Innexin n=1 Tax=Echinococcus multilocularis TaxID=6211 RepID=A0A068Y973_ECHMU|nr:Innexin unc 7 [Echinococcus multilocularis]
MEVSCDIEMIRDPDSRKSNITYVARHIEDALTSQREYRDGWGVNCRQAMARSCCFWFGKRYGNYLICLYLITKALYIFNVVGQFFLMNRILGTNYTFYGLDLIRDIAEGYLWEESGNFPRITLCDFEIRKLANSHRYTVQCVLPINMFNEKIFIFLWFWFILVSAFLKLRDSLEPGEKKRSYAFVDSYLRQDGVFILRLVAQNAGELVASEIVEKLWQMFKRRQSLPATEKVRANEVGWKSGVSGHSHIHSPPMRAPRSSELSPTSITSPSINAPTNHGPKHPFGSGLPPPPSVPAAQYAMPPPLPPPPGSAASASNSVVSGSTSSNTQSTERSKSGSKHSFLPSKKLGAKRNFHNRTIEEDPGEFV